MSLKALRVYFVTHHDGRLTGILMRHAAGLFDGPPPSAYGNDEEDVLQQIETQLRELRLRGKLVLDGYLFSEEFRTQRVKVDVFPLSVVKKQPVIGKKQIPLRLTYAASKLPGGGYRVMLPRFGWWFVVEELQMASEVIRNAVSTALLGESPRWMYEFRREAEERVREWRPKSILVDEPPTEDPAPEQPILDKVAEELVAKSAKGRLLAVVGEDKSIERAGSLYDRDPPVSILLVGDAGVGKSTWIRRLARKLALRRRDKRRKDDKPVPAIWATSGERIIAGMIYLGMWQQRCLDIASELKYSGDYLYVDRLTSILKLQPDGSSIAELFLAAMESEEISLIAECSDAELERARQRFPAFVNQFQIVRIAETQPADMPALLGLYEAKKRSVALHPEARKRAVQHLDSFEKGRRFPGKAFRFIDWLEHDSSTSATKPLYPSEISEAFSKYTGLPLELISDEHTVGAAEIADRLMSRVIGQAPACAAAAGVIARLKAAVNDPERPVGSLFFVGPTGVGKTELAKQVAEYLFGDSERLIRLDMSEYMLGGSGQRLLDVGEGVTSLAERVRRQPLSVILLDEIEKAHPEVFDLFLGVLGEGRLTDTLGRLVDFRMCLIVMTSNLGTSEGRAVGFGPPERGALTGAVRQHFRPEFFNRLDHVVTFRRLEPEDIERIVLLEIDKLSSRTGLRRRNLRLEIDHEARTYLAERGYHPTKGARPLKRLIEESVITPVAVRMAQEPDFRDRVVRVVRKHSAAWNALSESRRFEVISVG